MLKLLDTWTGQEFEVDSQKPLRIYICGPTVYTHTHVGHLKTYMTFDIVRRILEDYFKLKTQMMMNITNVDDKIIKGTYQEVIGNDINLDELTTNEFLDTQRFVDYADKWEKNFFEILDAMNIKRPNVVSRVTEYISEILEFVENIDNNGFAFEKDGSVYFYGTKYHQIKEDFDVEKQEYSQDPFNKYNFVLLKKKRPYEPGWQSKWGEIRPGWHIECSAMASSIYGNNFDIHGGGIDLKFPHHYNEVLQSHARFYPEQTGDNNELNKKWVSHFMHTGHLNIEGLKMSRSLKNFVTVKEIMNQYSHNELRMLFLLHRWNDPMDYSDQTMKGAIFFTNFFINFFKQSQSINLRTTTVIYKKFNELDKKQMDRLTDIQIQIDIFLKDNLDTPSTIKYLHTLVSELYTYVAEGESKFDAISAEILTSTTMYVKQMLDIFGLKFCDNQDSSKEAELLKVISMIRTDLRTIAKDIGKKLIPVSKELANEIPQEIYQLTDKVRDKMLPKIGIKLTDK